MRIVAFCGSLRRASFNRALLRTCIELAPQGMDFDAAEIGDVPLFNEDVEVNGFPEPAQRLRAQVAAADGLLFVTPEYNTGVPGVLKNAIDWVSRPPDQPFRGKPAAVLGASRSILGSVRGQMALRQSAIWLDLHFMNRPEVFVGRAHEMFDADLRLTDERTRLAVGKFMEAFGVWVERLAGTR